MPPRRGGATPPIIEHNDDERSVEALRNGTDRALEAGGVAGADEEKWRVKRKGRRKRRLNAASSASLRTAYGYASRPL